MTYTLNGTEYILRPWQERCLQEHRNINKLLLSVGTGQGKSLMSLILADRFVGKKLVICIKKKKKDWLRDTEGMNYIVMTRDEIRKFPIPDDIVCIIQDEVHEIVSNTTSKRFMILYNYLKTKMHLPHFILSATPIRSSWTSVFAYYCLLGLALPTDISKWRNTFQFLGKQWMKNAQGKAMERRCWKDRRDKETLEKIQRGIDKISFIYFETNPNATHHPTIKIPITMEFPITDTEPTSHDFYRLENKHPNKIAKLKELVIPWTVVICFYRDEVEYLKQLFNCNAVSGNDQYHDGLRDEPIVICQMQSATGYELPRHTRMVYFSYSYGITPFIQSRGRIDRGNAPVVDYYYLETVYFGSNDKTMDYNIRKSLEQGKDYDPSTWKKPCIM